MGQYLHIKSGKTVEIDDAQFLIIERQGCYARLPEAKPEEAKKSSAKRGRPRKKDVQDSLRDAAV